MAKPTSLVAASFLALLALPALQPAQGTPPCFDGSGGPNGDFDWVVRTGEVFLLDTTFTQIIGGPNGLPTAVLDVIDGVLDLRNLVIEPGAEVRVQGPNPLRVFATGDVVIRGQLDLSGFRARDVATLNTGNIVEVGGSGGPSGGSGGNANVNTSGSSSRGGSGNGPFGESGTGGEGGESGYASPALGKNARRPGGGGGARFAADRVGEPVPIGVGPLPTGASLVASDGNDGSPQGFGAESGLSPARGGAAGLGAFSDSKTSNDYFGLRPIVSMRPGGGQVVALLRGELPSLWAGYGGGGGGNAVRSSTFPNPSWNFSSDEKGGAGGGGGGALHVKALGQIVLGAQGLVLCNGGFGGTGENTNFLDHVGGTGGAGSGGHVVLESAAAIDFTDGGTNTSALPRTWIMATGRPLKTGVIADVDACCRTYSNGGASSGGVVQLHVPRAHLPPGTDQARTDILVPTAVAVLRNPLQAIGAPRAYELLPTCASFLHASFAGRSGGASSLPEAQALGLPALPGLPAAVALDVNALQLSPRP